MVTKRSRVETNPRRKPASCLLAAACMGLVLCLLFVHGHAAADADWRPQWAGAPLAQSPVTWQIEQQAIVLVQVDVRSAGDAALLESLGYSCGIGVCELELPDGDELALKRLGLAVRVVARAIKLSSPPRVAAAYVSEYGINATDITIIDPRGGGCGPVAQSPIVINGAPDGASVSTVDYSLRIAHSHVSDLLVRLTDSWSSLLLWNGYGGATDCGYDDDAADDADIELSKTCVTTFNGHAVNQTWYLTAQDCQTSGTGKLDYWKIWVWYDCAWLQPERPSNPSPPHGATNQSINVDLDWADCARATSYDVHFGVWPHAPKVGTVSSSYYHLPALANNTHFCWYIIAKGKCGETGGPAWEFTTHPATTPTRTATPSPTPTRTTAPTPTKTPTWGPPCHRIYLPLVLRQN